MLQRNRNTAHAVCRQLNRQIGTALFNPVPCMKDFDGIGNIEQSEWSEFFDPDARSPD